MYTKRYDYRREFMNMNLEELKIAEIRLQKEYHKWFINPFGEEEAEKAWRKLNYVKNKIQKF